jgi:hypothetical protein
MAAPNRNYNIKKSLSFTEFPVIFLNIVKIVERRKSISFHLKYSICCSTDYAAWGSKPLSPPPPFVAMLP